MNYMKIFGDPILVFSSFLLVDNVVMFMKSLVLVLTSVILFDKLRLILLIFYGIVKN
jgi:hypothetical protein